MIGVTASDRGHRLRITHTHRRLSHLLSFAAAIQKIQGQLDCVNVRQALSQ